MEQNEIIEIDLFQIHYYLNDKSHSMETLTLNKVESEFLKISQEVAKIFDCKLIIESQALDEGGLTSVYKFLVKKKNIKYTLATTAFLGTIIGNILTTVITNNLSEDKEQTALTKELTKAKIEESKSTKDYSELISEKTKLEIKNLKQKITKDSIIISQYLNEPKTEEELITEEK
jgi:hypothetical protein